MLLPVFAGVPGAERLFTDHLPGGAALGGAPRRRDRAVPPARTAGTRGPGAAAGRARRPRASDDRPGRWRTRRAPAGSRAAPPPADAGASPVPERITIQEFRDLHRSGEPVIVLDVRTERSYRDDPNIGVGAIRMPPDDAVRLARERRLDQHATLVLYCA